MCVDWRFVRSVALACILSTATMFCVRADVARVASCVYRGGGGQPRSHGRLSGTPGRLIVRAVSNRQGTIRCRVESRVLRASRTTRAGVESLGKSDRLAAPWPTDDRSWPMSPATLRTAVVTAPGADCCLDMLVPRRYEAGHMFVHVCTVISGLLAAPARCGEDTTDCSIYRVGKRNLHWHYTCRT